MPKPYSHNDKIYRNFDSYENPLIYVIFFCFLCKAISGRDSKKEKGKRLKHLFPFFFTPTP
ncbi:hypothetical protein DWB61_09405 [Ancylomarina euxinus]|uniref:Uncharacterized protein n=1 Tax=Ancylomarina euxinus TaxID=2283627 RepID=A0A425Y100_9BACT|nr:hypothetical protein DWB61_09405 [Ancylomarina euxinus]